MKLSTEALDHLNRLPLGDHLQRYIEQGSTIHGDFLGSVVRNDLCKAAREADSTNQKLLSDYALFLVWYAPKEAYGSNKKVKRWISKFQK